MAKKAPTPDPTPKPGKLDLWHKGLYPAIYLSVVIFFGLCTLFFGWTKWAADGEVEQLKGAVKQHAEQEQRAREETQWLRVEVSKYGQRQKKKDDIAAKQVNSDDVDARARFALLIATPEGGLDAIKKDEAEKFGEEV